MEIGDRIKSRREELGMSQEELAKKVGYKSRSSVNKIEIDGRGLPQSKVVEFAKALETTPAYLMGWNEETIEIKYNTLTSCDSESLNKYADYLYLRERQLITDRNSDEYIEFIISEETHKLNKVGKREALKRINELTKISWYSDEIKVDAAHARTDMNVPEGIDTSDNDIMDDENF